MPKRKRQNTEKKNSGAAIPPSDDFDGNYTSPVHRPVAITPTTSSRTTPTSKPTSSTPNNNSVHKSSNPVVNHTTTSTTTTTPTNVVTLENNKLFSRELIASQHSFRSIQATEIAQKELAHHAARMSEFAIILDIHMKKIEQAQANEERERHMKRRLDPDYREDERVVAEDEFV